MALQMIRPIALENPKWIPARLKFLGAIVAVGLAFWSQDSMLFLFGMVVLYYLVTILYNKTEPPVLLFSALFGWFFFQGQLFNAMIKGERITSLEYFSATKPTIIVLGLIAVIVFFTGVYFTSRKRRGATYEEIKAFLMRVNVERLLLSYVAFYILQIYLASTLWMFSSLSQPLLVMGQFKWALFFLLFITVFAQNRLKFWLLVIILGDIAMSFFSFFASFKEVIYFSFLSYWIFFFRYSIISKGIAIACVAVTFYLGAYWSAIKEPYRDFLNLGTGAQTIGVTREQAYSKLGDLVGSLRPEDVDQGVETLVTRLSWIGAFDAVYNHVPKWVPHEDGDLWLEGIRRPFLPRIIYSGKKALADSKELNYYSGLNVDEKHTSISMSMVAGSYVDFGSTGMFIPIFLFGLFCGWIYKKAIQWGRHPVVGYALTMPMIYLMQINEQSINRIVSSVVLYFLALWFLQKFCMRPFLNFVIIPEKQTRPKQPVNGPVLG